MFVYSVEQHWSRVKTLFIAEPAGRAGGGGLGGLMSILCQAVSFGDACKNVIEMLNRIWLFFRFEALSPFQISLNKFTTI